MSDVATGRSSRTKAAGGVLAATCISTLVVNANTSAVSILLPAISEDTGMGVDTLQWAVTGYSLVGAAVIITSGSLGDVLGRKKVFQLGLALFVISCVLIALAESGGMVIAGRLIQGAAGATILACGLSLLTVATSGDQRLKFVSLWGAAAAVGAAAGPLLGGLLVDITGWQGLFWIDAGVAVGCMALTFATVQESRDEARPRSIDYLGTVLIALTLAPLIYGFTKSGDWGWISAATLGCFAASIVAGFLFVRTEKRVAVPLLDLALLRNRILVGSTLAILIGAGTINGLMYLLSLYFQNPAALGFSPLEAGVATLPATVGLVVVAPLVPRLARRLGGRQVIGVGFIAMVAGFAAIGLVDSAWAYTAFLLPHPGDRRRHGPQQRSRVVGRDRVRPAGAGRRGLRGLQHGAVRRRGGRDRPVRHDLRQRGEQPARRRRQRRRRPGIGPGRRLVAAGRDQRARHPPRPGRDPPSQGGRGHRSGRRRLGRRAPAHDPDHCLGQRIMSAVPFTRDDYAARMARVVADGEACVDGVLVPAARGIGTTTHEPPYMIEGDGPRAADRRVTGSSRRRTGAQCRNSLPSTARTPSEAAPADSSTSRQPRISARWAPR